MEKTGTKRRVAKRMKEKEFNWQKFHEELDFVLATYLIDTPKGSIYDEILELAQFSNHKRLLQNKPVFIDAPKEDTDAKA